MWVLLLVTVVAVEAPAEAGMAGVDAKSTFADAQVPQSTASECERWVAPGGSNRDDGTPDRPWATLQYALDAIPISGCAIAVMPGTYQEELEIRRRYGSETLVRAVEPYRSTIAGFSTAVDIEGAANVAIEGFEIRQANTTGNNVLVSVEDRSGWESTNITIRNNVIHDAFDNDLLKVRSGARFITVEGNVFYNPHAAEQHIDINGVNDIVIQDNLFFNDYAGSGRANPADAKAFIVVKDSSGTGELGSRRVAIRRNVFMNWQGGNEPFLQIGNDGKAYHEAVDVTIENNLLLGNSPIKSNGALGVAGARNVSFINNTVVGDLPSSQYAGRFVRKGSNPPNENIVMANNIFSDHTGTMGQLTGGESSGVSLLNNLYSNNGIAIDASGPLRATDDPQRIMANPHLPQNHSSVVLPRWTGDSFASGSSTIRQEFLRIVELHAKVGTSSAAIDRADPAHAPVEDILQRPRTAAPDVGAWEQVTSTNAPPMAVDDVVSTPAGVSVDVNVLGNDFDTDGDVLSVTGVSSPAHGVVSVLANQRVRYTPAVGFSGVDSFTYRASDGVDVSNPATVSVTVVAADPPPNNPPVVNPIPDFLLKEGQTITIPVVASDPDGDPLTITVAGLPSFGTFNPGNRTITLAPTAGQAGSYDPVTVSVADNPPGGTAPTYVSSASVATGTSTDTATIPQPGGVQQGDLLLAQVRYRGSATGLRSPTGWTLLGRLGDSGANHAVYYRLASGSEPASYSFIQDTTSGKMAGAVVAYRGVDQTDPIDAWAASAIDTSTLIAPSLTVGVDNTTVIRLWGFRSYHDGTGMSGNEPPTGVTARWESWLDSSASGTDRNRVLGGDHLQKSAGPVGTAVADGSIGTSESRRSAFTVALRPAASGGNGAVVSTSFKITVSADDPPDVGAPAHVASTTGAIGASTTDTVVLPRPSGVQQGDLLLAQIRYEGRANRFRPPTGWTLLGRLEDSDANHAVYYRLASNPEPVSYSFVQDTKSGRMAAAVAAYRGVDQARPIDAWAMSAVNTATLVAPNATATAANTTVLRLWGFRHNSTGPSGVTPTVGVTARWESLLAANVIGTGGNRVLGGDHVNRAPGPVGTATARGAVGSAETRRSAFTVIVRPG